MTSKKLKVIISIVAISFIQGLQFSVSPVLGQISEHFSSVSVNLIQMLVTSSALMAMVIALISGKLVTKISKKNLLIIAGFVAGITGFIPLLSDSFGLLFACRILYGVAQGLATALNTAVVAEFFTGDERTSVMGIQAASVGAGMLITTTLAGLLAKGGFTHAYWVHTIGFICMITIAVLLPETGVVKETESEKIRLNADVFKVSLFGFLEFLFLISYSTNIAMHLGGSLAGNPSISGTLTGIFSGAQIVMGLVLGQVTKVTKRMTMPVGMLFFALGGVILILFPASFPMLLVGSVFCGFSQGMFVPTAMVAVSNAVAPVAAAMAAAVITCFTCVGQLISPAVLNGITGAVFGDVATGHVFTVAVIGMVVSALLTTLIGRTVKHM